MPDIELVRSYSVPLAEAKARLEKIAAELTAEHDLRTEWRGNSLFFERTGLHGEMHLTASKIRLEATLGFLFKPLRGALIDRIERKFEKAFPERAPELERAHRAKKPAHK